MKGLAVRLACVCVIGFRFEAQANMSRGRDRFVQMIRKNRDIQDLDRSSCGQRRTVPVLVNRLRPGYGIIAPPASSNHYLH
jgi:hypothetical protein